MYIHVPVSQTSIPSVNICILGLENQEIYNELQFNFTISLLCRLKISPSFLLWGDLSKVGGNPPIPQPKINTHCIPSFNDHSMHSAQFLTNLFIFIYHMTSRLGVK